MIVLSQSGDGSQLHVIIKVTLVHRLRIVAKLPVEPCRLLHFVFFALFSFLSFIFSFSEKTRQVHSPSRLSWFQSGLRLGPRR